MSAVFLDRGTAPSIGTLVLATATGAVAMNVFLPSLPAMAEHFHTDYAVAQLAVSFYLAATAGLQLVLGPLSDRFGRRPVMLASFLIFMAATLGAIFAPTIEFLLACRLLQAFAASGVVLSRAIIGDVAGPAEAASKIGYVTMGMALAPMVGPAIGGLLDEFYGWKSTFWLTFAFGVLAFLVIWFDLGETNRHRSASFGAQFASYPDLMRSRRFWGYSATAAFTSGAFFAFLGGAPYVGTQMLGLSPSAYGLYFGIISFGYALGNFLSGRYSQRIGLNRMMLLGNIIAAGGMMIALILFTTGPAHALFFFGPAFFTGVGNGISLPNAMAGIVSVRPHLAGSASGLGGALQFGGGALLSVIAGTLLGPATGPYPLIAVMIASSLAAVIATLYVIHVARRAGALTGTGP
jgi:DHA1 family bicyclomycin/chloramphenicol resistance-like MFS transporter